jgi:hypothetical protein
MRQHTLSGDGPSSSRIDAGISNRGLVLATNAAIALCLALIGAGVLGLAVHGWF